MAVSEVITRQFGCNCDVFEKYEDYNTVKNFISSACIWDFYLSDAKLHQEIL